MDEDLEVKIPPVITFASHRQEREWQDERLPQLLRDIVTDAAEYAFDRYGWIFVLTSIFRTIEENEAALAKTTIHCVYRAIDVRTKTAKQEWIDDVGKRTNSMWQYDPKRPLIPVAYWGPHGDGSHIHYQIHFDTVRKS